jgi:5-formyltetrahydrofolate cyclo-ligase
MSAEDPVVARKRELRAAMRARLREFAPQARAEAAQRACAHVIAAPWFSAARCVFAFVSLPQEIDTAPLLRAVLAADKLLAVPRATVATGSMELVAIEDLDDLHEGPLRVREPRGGRVLDLAAVDLAVVPGLAFDRQGGRLGRGGGYYDRCLRQRALLTCGLAFAAQVVDAVPMEGFDCRVAWLATEQGLTAC